MLNPQIRHSCLGTGTDSFGIAKDSLGIAELLLISCKLQLALVPGRGAPPPNMQVDSALHRNHKPPLLPPMQVNLLECNKKQPPVGSSHLSLSSPSRVEVLGLGEDVCDTSGSLST